MCGRDQRNGDQEERKMLANGVPDYSLAEYWDHGNWSINAQLQMRLIWGFAVAERYRLSDPYVSGLLWQQVADVTHFPTWDDAVAQGTAGTPG